MDNITLFSLIALFVLNIVIAVIFISKLESINEYIDLIDSRIDSRTMSITTLRLEKEINKCSTINELLLKHLNLKVSQPANAILVPDETQRTN